MGSTEEISSVSGPMMPTSRSPSSSWWTAGTASVESHPVSAYVTASWRPRTPPAPLIAVSATCAPWSMARPSGARMPVKHERTPKPIVPLLVVLIGLAVAPPLHAATASSTAAQQAHPRRDGARRRSSRLPPGLVPLARSAGSLIMSTSDWRRRRRPVTAVQHDHRDVVRLPAPHPLEEPLDHLVGVRAVPDRVGQLGDVRSPVSGVNEPVRVDEQRVSRPQEHPVLRVVRARCAERPRAGLQ